jgi:nickel/cobalt transporter (NicO) family protein
MDSTLLVLLGSAASIGFFHTLLGPDHFIPFILLSKSRNWTYSRTLWITLGCGLAHVGSSVLLGLAGVLFGWSLNHISIFDNSRGNVAAWLLIVFGLAYMIWGFYRAHKNKPHTHWHAHVAGEIHKHEHVHAGSHSHVHEGSESGNLTPWVLFLIFVFGPCEPLIPFLIYPAAQGSTTGLILVIGVFSLTTILTMLGIVLLSTKGIRGIALGKYEKFTHAIAGAFILLCGIGMQFFGL